MSRLLIKITMQTSKKQQRTSQIMSCMMQGKLEPEHGNSDFVKTMEQEKLWVTCRFYFKRIYVKG